MFKDVKLSSGDVRIYQPPNIKIHYLISQKYPLPTPPIVEVPTAAGETLKMIVDDDPAYLEKKAEIELKRRKEQEEMTLLFALRDVQVPADFDISNIAELVKLYAPDWKPRTGEAGRKLDYIEWVLMGNSADAAIVNDALMSMLTISEEVVTAVADSFRN